MDLSMGSQVKILAIVPAYNEEKSVSAVVATLKQVAQKHSLLLDIMVINDGSKDSTAEVIKKEDVIGVNLPYNMGIGNTVHTGYLYARKHNYDIALQFDGDGQHPAQEIPALIQPLLRGQADFTIGSRFLNLNAAGFKSTRSRQMGIYFFSHFISFLLGIKITDPTSGFRAVNRQGIRVFSAYYPYDYPEPEAIAVACQNGLKLQEVPVQMKEREHGHSSINTLKSIYYMIKVTLSIWVQSLAQTRVLDSED